MAEKKAKTGSKPKRRTARKRGGGRGVQATGTARRRGGAVAVIARDPDLAGELGSGRSLVIVESPAKAKTIGKYLGRDYRVKATVGHVLDLPKKKMGIDIENGFEPQFEPIPGKEKTLADLKSAAREAREIFIATDPDREGEAIAYHVSESIKTRGRSGAPIRRVLFHEITKDAVERAIANAGEIDEKKVGAQQARRLLDRLVGYKASPLLWKTVKKGLSAGRVQTVALRILVERERDIRAFRPTEYWTVEAQLEKSEQRFIARLHQVDGKKPEIPGESEAQRILAELAGRDVFPVTDIKRRERRKNPAAPFTTSTLQQEAAKKLGFGSKRTMRVAQDLYEGIDIGDEGAVGLITYMRTDSTRVAESAARQAQDYVRTLFGADFLAQGLQLYGGKNQNRTQNQNTQDAHEGVRPTDPTRRPDQLQRFLAPDQLKLYQLIWQRFMASQMAPAVFDTTTIDFDLDPAASPVRNARRYLFRSTGSVVKFQGFLALYKETREEGDSKALEDEQALPVIERGERVKVVAITPSQHFTEPPPRFSEASLVKELERLGIGRPSTYASIISVLVDRHYVRLEQRRFFPTELGETVEKVMVKQFPEIFDVGFTSAMEGELDKVEEGELTWRRVLEDFYGPFNASLQDVKVDELIAAAHDLSAMALERCPLCGGHLVAKGGFFGPYVACEHHPKPCKYTRPLKGEKQKPVMTAEKCQLCGAPMVIRTGRSGQFLGCSTFPKCRGTRPMPSGVKCPKDGGDLIERRSKKRGSAFFACANDSCDFVVWNKVVPENCPECGFPGAEVKSTKLRGEFRKCLRCANEWEAAEAEAEPTAVA
ncbi:MAG: type I DNA topoisomerase [Gemmatimonadaceae bacterium]